MVGGGGGGGGGGSFGGAREATGFRWIDIGRWSVWSVSDGIKDEIRLLHGFDFWFRLDGGRSASSLLSTTGSKLFCGPSAGFRAGARGSGGVFRREVSESDVAFESEEPLCEWDRNEEREREEGRRVARKDLLEVILG